MKLPIKELYGYRESYEHHNHHNIIIYIIIISSQTWAPISAREMSTSLGKMFSNEKRI
jgi:hypothetical protein